MVEPFRDGLIDSVQRHRGDLGRQRRQRVPRRRWTGLHRYAFPESLSGLHEVQQREKAGTSLEASRAGGPVVVSRLADHAARWPAFVEEAAALGVGAVAAVPIGVDRVVGAASLYAPADRDRQPTSRDGRACCR
jgi:hypothetical protein